MLTLAACSFPRLRNLSLSTALVLLATCLGLSPRSMAEAGNSAQSQSFVVERNGGTIAIEPYGPNIVRITLSVTKEAALAPVGYGIIGSSKAAGWTQEPSPGGAAVYSDRRNSPLAFRQVICLRRGRCLSMN